MLWVLTHIQWDHHFGSWFCMFLRGGGSSTWVYSGGLLWKRSGVFISLLPPVTKLKKENVILERKQESTLWRLFGNVAHNLILVFSFVAVDAKGPQYVWLWMGSRTRKRTSTRGHHILMRSFIDSSRWMGAGFWALILVLRSCETQTESRPKSTQFFVLLLLRFWKSGVISKWKV